MRKRILSVLLFSAISLCAMGGTEELQTNISEINGRIITQRGKEQFRDSIIFKKMDRRGYSGSSQYLEGIGELESDYDGDRSSDYSSKTKGFLTGTNSTFLAYPNLITGVSMGYVKSKVDYDDAGNSSQKVRTYGVNAYLAYNYNNWLFIGQVGYDESKNILKSEGILNTRYRTKNYSLGAEAGYFFDIGEKSLLYPYVGLGWNQYTTKGHDGIEDNNDRVGSGNIGLTYSTEFMEKFMFTANAEWNYDFADRKDLRTSNDKLEIMETSRDRGIISAGLGYYLQEDFLITLKYMAFTNSNYYHDMVILGFTHNF